MPPVCSGRPLIVLHPTSLSTSPAPNAFPIPDATALPQQRRGGTESRQLLALKSQCGCVDAITFLPQATIGIFHFLAFVTKWNSYSS